MKRDAWVLAEASESCNNYDNCFPIRCHSCPHIEAVLYSLHSCTASTLKNFSLHEFVAIGLCVAVQAITCCVGAC
jgi:hypothetical protein